MIAGALACGPKLLIADEPTTALDVTIQAQVLTLLRDLQARLGTAVVFITHDLGVIAEIAEEVMVMYAGHVVERTSVAALFDAPQHPYSRALVESRPVVGARRLDRLPAIPGQVPSLTDRPSGCPFHPRCPHVMDRCRTTLPGRYDAGESTDVLCWLYTDGGGARGED
jgi:oligopeptide/dipeptide ABC transporter ATP-binding protein